MYLQGLVVVFAVLAQASALRYNQELKFGPPPTRNSFEYSSSPIFGDKEKTERGLDKKLENLAPQFQMSSYKSPMPLNTMPLMRNIVAKGKYSVSLQNCGPSLDKKIPVYTSHMSAPVQEKPTVRLSSNIPAPRTIAHSCTCYKTIVKPRVQQTLITVPSIERYVETTHRPIIENIHYEAYPIKCEKPSADSQPQASEPQEFSASGENGMDQASLFQNVQILGLESSEVPQGQNYGTLKINNEKENENSLAETFDFPVHFMEAPKSQSVELSHLQPSKSQKLQEVPHVQFMTKKPQTIEIPSFQFSETQKPHTIEIPRIQFVEACKPQTLEIPQGQKTSGMGMPRVQVMEPKKTNTIELPPLRFVDGQKCETVEVPLMQFPEVQKTQNFEVPCIQFSASQKPQTVEIPRIQFIEAEKFQNLETSRGQKEETKNSMMQQPGILSFGSEPQHFGYTFNQ